MVIIVMKEKEFEVIIKTLEGSTVSATDLSLITNSIYNSKEEAKKYKRIFHCTRSDVLKKIIETKEFWLRNIQEVNDEGEKKSIDVLDYRNSYYVACFTYENNVSEEHWKEYADEDLSDGVLFSVKREWFKKSAVFMDDNNVKAEEEDYRIYSNYEEAINKGLNNNLDTTPFYIMDIEFYKVIYDDNLKLKIGRPCVWTIGDNKYAVELFLPEAAGIVKCKKGPCHRPRKETYEKSWEDEKEIRLKIGISQKPNFYSSKIAVKLTENAFDEFEIRFSPKYDRDKKESYLRELKLLCPTSKITVL